MKSLVKRYNWLTKVHFDKKSGFHYYDRYRYKVFIRHPRHYLPEKDIQWLCENIIYKHYLPKDADQVVDLGVGYGDEAVYLKNLSPQVKYLGVEAQPVIYECACNTFRQLGSHFSVSPFAVSNEKSLRFASQFGYAAVGDTDNGYIEIPTLTWPELLDRYHIAEIDLLKMNIEGAERHVLSSIVDFSKVKRLVVSCHDFRANHGDGESFRTKEFVTKTLSDNGYHVTFFNYGMDWSDDWIFASRI
ncbi:MAG TPA: FkbM family methyltransferase [Gammaproteobacteria bacterium]